MSLFWGGAKIQPDLMKCVSGQGRKDRDGDAWFCLGEMNMLTMMLTVGSWRTKKEIEAIHVRAERRAKI
jgi:hypothetical protein